MITRAEKGRHEGARGGGGERGNRSKVPEARFWGAGRGPGALVSVAGLERLKALVRLLRNMATALETMRIL